MLHPPRGAWHSAPVRTQPVRHLRPPMPYMVSFRSASACRSAAAARPSVNSTRVVSVFGCRNSALGASGPSCLASLDAHLDKLLQSLLSCFTLHILSVSSACPCRVRYPPLQGRVRVRVGLPLCHSDSGCTCPILSVCLSSFIPRPSVSAGSRAAAPAAATACWPP